MTLRDILMNLPEVSGPLEKKLDFKTKMKWTLIVLACFFVLANIPLFGLAANALARFEYLSIILGTEFGSIISLGIGPIVMSSIILQLLVGAKILNIDLREAEGKRFFQGLQKFLAIFFCLFEAVIYVVMGGLSAMPGMVLIVITQLFFGGILIIFMDEVMSKWGIGSGVSMFIAANVGWSLFAGAFGFIGAEGQIAPVGKLWVFFASIAEGNTAAAGAAGFAILATILIFLLVVYTQSIKVEIPLGFGRIRGLSMKWPLNFFYASNIPVILTAALLANVQLFAKLAETKFGTTILGGFSTDGSPISGLALWLNSPPLLESIIRGSFQTSYIWQALIYIMFMVGGSVMFAIFWVKTAGMSAENQAKQIVSSGLQIPGFRQDPRILESILNRYIMPLTVMGGAAVGFLAATADLMGALVRGTGLLLAVMIIYRFYEDISKQHAYDMHPALRKVIASE